MHAASARCATAAAGDGHVDGNAQGMPNNGCNRANLFLHDCEVNKSIIISLVHIMSFVDLSTFTNLKVLQNTLTLYVYGIGSSYLAWDQRFL